MNNKKIISVYTLPPGSRPIARVECPDKCIEAGRLFEVCCDIIGLYRKSRELFGLFRGLLHPVKKYGSGEIIALPVATYPVCILKWSFDVTLEKRLIKTDPIALRQLALQYKSDLELKRKHPDAEQHRQLMDLDNPEFPCHKQYLEFARTIIDYDWTAIKGIEVVKKVKLISNHIEKGSKVDLTCTPKKMIIIAGE